MSYSGRKSMHRLFLEVYRVVQWASGSLPAGSDGAGTSAPQTMRAGLLEEYDAQSEPEMLNGARSEVDSRLASPAVGRNNPNRHALAGVTGSMDEGKLDSSEFGSRYESIGRESGGVPSGLSSPREDGRQQGKNGGGGNSSLPTAPATWKDTYIRIGESIILVGMTTAGAIFLPGITVIFGLTGSVTATALMCVSSLLFALSLALALSPVSRTQRQPPPHCLAVLLTIDRSSLSSLPLPSLTSSLLSPLSLPLLPLPLRLLPTTRRHACFLGTFSRRCFSSARSACRRSAMRWRRHASSPPVRVVSSICLDR